MKKLLLLIFGIVLMLLISIFAIAKPDTERVPATNAKAGINVVIPKNAIEVAPGIFSLGSTQHNGEIVEGYAIVDYRKGFSHKPQHTGNGGAAKCYAFLASGAKWKTVEPYQVNPANTKNLNEIFVFDNIALDVGKWETASGVNILGDGNLTAAPLSADTSSPDGKNEVYFANVVEQGAIAVTIVWGVFSGPIFNRKLVEWDQVYDDVDYDWSSSGEAGKMDFENIASHEIGHSTGMGHPSDSCTEETMFRFADFGETKKRDLNSGDIQGIQALY